jgi:hypothetical protein
MNRQCLGRVNGRFIRCTMAEIFVRTAEPFDFDRIEHWGPALKAEVSDLLPSDVARIISAADPESIEDARDELFKVIDRHVIIARASSWIEAGPVVAYHGSRLNPEEIEAVRREGLKPLIAASRADRLRSSALIPSRLAGSSTCLRLPREGGCSEPANRGRTRALARRTAHGWR